MVCNRPQFGSSRKQSNIFLADSLLSIGQYLKIQPTEDLCRGRNVFFVNATNGKPLPRLRLCKQVFAVSYHSTVMSRKKGQVHGNTRPFIAKVKRNGLLSFRGSLHNILYRVPVVRLACADSYGMTKKCPHLGMTGHPAALPTMR